MYGVITLNLVYTLYGKKKETVHNFLAITKYKWEERTEHCVTSIL